MELYLVTAALLHDLGKLSILYEILLDSTNLNLTIINVTEEEMLALEKSEKERELMLKPVGE